MSTMRSVLYYPFITPGERWFRHALLTWDRVYTLASPESPPPPVAIRRLNDAVGGALEVIPLAGLGNQIGGSFLAWLDGIDIPTSGPDNTPEAMAAYGMYDDKFTDEMLGVLESRGL